MEQELQKAIGGRIRLYRKIKNMSLETLAGKIHKSKASVSKYELGQTAVDIATLYEIADVLGVAPGQLLDGTAGGRGRRAAEAIPFKTDVFFLYFLTKGQISLSKLVFEPSDNTPDCPAVLYHDLTGFESPDSCKSLYRGVMQSTNVFMSVMLQSVRIPSSHVLLCFTLPLDKSEACVGMLSGFGSGLMRPMAMKVILSATQLKLDERLRRRLGVGSEAQKLLKREDRFYALPDDVK